MRGDRLFQFILGVINPYLIEHVSLHFIQRTWPHPGQPEDKALRSFQLLRYLTVLIYCPKWYPSNSDFFIRQRFKGD